MSTEPTPDPTATAAPHTIPTRPVTKKAPLWRYLIFGQSKSDELAVYQHSNLFYWWPVWFFGYLVAAITYFDDMRMAIVPPGTEAVPGRVVFLDDELKKNDKRDVLILPEKAHLPTGVTETGGTATMQPTYFMAQSKGWGSLFMVILLIVIIITNVALRGLWSFLVLIVLVMFALLATAAGWWEPIMARVGHLAVYINMGGYLLLSTVLLIFWFVGLFVFDRQTYMIFTPGQVRLRLEIGDGETVYDTAGMVVQKQRGDLFRHWVLGFGSGDLIIRPVGLANPIHLHNVLRVGGVVRAIELMVKEKVVLTQTAKS